MKCTKCGSANMKFQSLQNLTDKDTLIPLAAAYIRCEDCWETHQFMLSNHSGQCDHSYKDELCLMGMTGEGREHYFKCSKPGDDTFTLIARKSYATKERLKSMGFTVHEREDDLTLPKYRLYELK